jgi:hypothetical protein
VVRDEHFQGFHFPLSVSGKRNGVTDGRLPQFLKGVEEENLHVTFGCWEGGASPEFVRIYQEGPGGEDPYLVLHMTSGHEVSGGKSGCVGLVKIDWDRVEDVPLNNRRQDFSERTIAETEKDFFHPEYLRQRKDPDWHVEEEFEGYICPYNLGRDFVVPVKPVTGTRLHIENPIPKEQWNKMYNGQSWKRHLVRNHNVRAPLSEWVEMLK